MNLVNKNRSYFKKTLVIFLGFFFAFVLVLLFDSFIIPFLVKKKLLSFSPQFTNNYKFEAEYENEILSNISKKVIEGQGQNQQDRYYKGNLRYFYGSKELENGNRVIESEVMLKDTGKVVFKVTEHIDQYGRRKTHKNKSHRARHLLIFGGSYAYGHGLNDEQSLPWLLHTKQQKYEVYNIAQKGYGPNSVLLDIYNKNFLDGIKQKKGIGIYLFTEFHLFRAIGDMNTIGIWGENLPVLKESGDNKFKVLGKFKDVHPILTKIYQSLVKTNIHKMLGVNFPRLSVSHYNLCAKLIKSIRHEYWNKTNRNNKFLIIIYPEKIARISRSLLKKAFDDEGLQFIDYSVVSIDQLTKSDVWIPLDGHPNFHANDIVSDLILSDAIK